MRLLSKEKIPSNKIDLRIGNPSFLKEYWKTYNENVEYPTNLYTSMDYEKEGGRESLKEVILELHKKVKNANSSGKSLVVGNGATQMINATIHALKVKYGLNHVGAKAPHWFRFPEMTNMLGCQFSEADMIMKNWVSPEVSAAEDMFINIATCPSNPENKLEHWTRSKYMIWDLCYMWPHYTNDVRRVDENIMIFSLSKATGHGGSRIGWGFFADDEIADLVQRYIEYDTGGVSVEAQVRAQAVIKTQLAYLQDYKRTQFSCFDYGSNLLEKRWNQLKQLSFLASYGNKKAKFKILNTSGMFGWCEYLGELKESEDLVTVINKKYDLLVLDGKSSDSFSTKNFRINIGCDRETFDRFILKFA